MSNLFDEYLEWSPGSKVELVEGRLVFSDSLTHSLRLLSQILRGWGSDAIVALAPEHLWWQALSHTFDAPAIASLRDLNAVGMHQWAEAVQYQAQTPPHLGSWRWSYSQLRQVLLLTLFRLGGYEEKLGQSLGGGCVNRLGQDAFMPDSLFFRGEPRNRLYEYYLDGAAEIAIEFLQPGCEDYVYQVKKPIYAAAGVPELWVFDVAARRLKLLRLVEGVYQPQVADATGRYRVMSVPGLTFFPNQVWLDQSDWSDPDEETWFAVSADAPRLDRIRPIASGVDWSKALLKFPVSLDPVAIKFEDYLYWCPEAKFEFVNGRPEIGGREGIKGLAGTLLMTFGLAEVVKLAHPRDWVSALLESRAQALDPQHKAAVWSLARNTAQFLRDHYPIDRIVVVGDLVDDQPITVWSELVLFAWGLPQVESDQPEFDRHYTRPEAIVRQLSDHLRIRLVDANKELTAVEVELLNAGSVEL